MYDDALRSLAEAVQRRRCVPIIGAGVSATYVDPLGHATPGCPTAPELVTRLKARRSYLSDVDSLPEAMTLLKQRDGRPEVEQFLRDALGAVKPLPAHQSLARIPFESYVSFNFDELLEEALRREHGSCTTIVEDRDIPLSRGRGPVVLKPHGTLSRPRTMRVALDECVSLQQASVLLHALLTTWLAERTVLFLGFGLRDPDFISAYFSLKQTLGEHMPRSTAVVLSASEALRAFWQSQGVDVITGDLTDFLSRLAFECQTQGLDAREDLEPWLKHVLFRQLIEIRSLPTETQVIDSLLAQIKARFEAGGQEADLGRECLEAIDLVLEHRRNFSGLRALRAQLENLFLASDLDRDARWARLLSLESARDGMRRALASRGAIALKPYKRVLLYSQSQRVIDALLAVPSDRQKLVTLIIAECRPKSPNDFQDALSTARLLGAAAYPIQLVPDVAALHVLLEGRVDAVALGVHTVYCDANTKQPLGFVNTCGSAAIAVACKEHTIPLLLVYETSKIVEVTDPAGLVGRISFAEEERIEGDTIRQLSREGTLAERARVLNVGYDYVPWSREMVSIVDVDVITPCLKSEVQ